MKGPVDALHSEVYEAIDAILKDSFEAIEERCDQYQAGSDPGCPLIDFVILVALWQASHHEFGRNNATNDDDGGAYGCYNTPRVQGICDGFGKEIWDLVLFVRVVLVVSDLLFSQVEKGSGTVLTVGVPL